MQNNSEHIHDDPNQPIRCPASGVCIGTNFGVVNMNSHNMHTSQMDNCGNRNQC